MITIKKYLSNSLQLMFIFAFIVMNFLTFNVYGDQSSVLAQDEKGNYLIKTEEDFHNTKPLFPFSPSQNPTTCLVGSLHLSHFVFNSIS